MGSHETRPGTVPPKPELWGSQRCFLQVLHHFLPTELAGCLILDCLCQRPLFLTCDSWLCGPGPSLVLAHCFFKLFYCWRL